MEKYDKDHSNTLDVHEISNFMNDAVKQMKLKKQMTQEEIKKLICKYDQNGDQKLSKTELLEILKRVEKAVWFHLHQSCLIHYTLWINSLVLVQLMFVLAMKLGSKLKSDK